MFHQNCSTKKIMIIFVVDINFSDMAQGNTTFGFELANHPNRFGFYPIMLRITRDRKKKRVKTGLEVKKSDWNLLFANITLISLPIIAIYCFLQKYIVSGMTAGAVKG